MKLKNKKTYYRVLLEDDHHASCARLLMNEWKVPKSYLKEVIDLIKLIYNSEHFAHSLIVLSVRGFRESRKTLELQYFLAEHGRRPESTFGRNHDAMADF